MPCDDSSSQRTSGTTSWSGALTNRVRQITPVSSLVLRSSTRWPDPQDNEHTAPYRRFVLCGGPSALSLVYPNRKGKGAKVMRGQLNRKRLISRRATDEEVESASYPHADPLFLHPSAVMGPPALLVPLTSPILSYPDL